MPTNPDTLFQEASCFRCNSNASEADLLELALLDRISQAASSDATPGGADGAVQFNDGGVFGGDSNFTFNKTTDTLTIPNIGSPAATALQFASAGTNRANFSTSGHLLWNTDNTLDIGAIGANRPRDINAGTIVRSPLVAIAANTNATAITIAAYSLTGANAQSMVDLSGTWNTTGTPTAIDLNITDTASNAASLLMNLRTGGLTSMSVSKDRILRIGNSAVGGAAELQVHQGGGNTFGIRVLSPRAGLNRNSTLFFCYYDITNGNTVLDTIFGGAKVQLMTANVSKWEVANAGHFITGLDNTYDIGASGATRPRFGYFGTRVDAPTLRTDTAFTVGTLPAAGVAGRRAYVTDATAPTFGGALVGGGAVVIPVFDNGAAWVSA